MNSTQKQNKLIKQIAIVIAIAITIIGLQFGISKYIFEQEDETQINFYEYRIAKSEIVISPETYTGEEVKVEITTQKPGLSIQYQLEGTDEWIDYTGPFSVDDNIKVNTRLVSKQDNFEGPITDKDITNIGVARIGDTTYKTITEAIAACPENAGSTPTVIEMLTSTAESFVIPEGKNIVLDLKGNTVTSTSDATATVNGEFNLINTNAQGQDNTLGGLVSTTGAGVKVTSTGNFTLGKNETTPVVNTASPVIGGNTYGVIVEEGGEFNFYDGKISGKINAINGTVTNTPEGFDVIVDEEGEYEVATLKAIHTVTFDKNAENATVEYESVVKYTGDEIASLPTAQREGYELKGWFTEKENGIQITLETKVTQDVTYYAQWEAHTYEIKYNSNGGTGTQNNTQATYDEQAQIPQNSFTQPEGYTFKEWNTNADGTGTSYKPGDMVQNLTSVQNGEVNLYAIWEDITPPTNTAPTGIGTTNTITVNCNQTDSGSGIDTNTIEYSIYKDGKWSDWQSSNIFEGLNTNTEYEVKTRVQDIDGNGPTESAVGKIKTATIENAKIEIRENNENGSIITPETNPDNKDNQVNTDLYIDVTPSTTGTTTITVKNPDGTTNTYVEDTTIPTVTGKYEITVETTDGTNTVIDTYYVYVDKTNPTVEPTSTSTTNSIIVNANEEDADSGVADVTYTIKNGDEIIATNKTGEFTGLDDNTEYIVEITVTDNAGNTTTTTETIKTQDLLPGSLDFTETTSGDEFTPTNTEAEEKVWINENASIELTPGNAGTTTYEVTAPDGTKTTYTTDTQITTQEGTYTVTVTTTDGKNTETVTYYFNVDKTNPTVTIDPNGKEYTIAVSNNMATVGTTLTATDNENGSGIAFTKYAWSTSNTQEPESWSDFTNAAQVTKSVEGGKYYLWTNVEDKAGNKAVLIKTSKEFNVGYAVEFNANGGEGQIASQRKEHGVDLTITNEKPTRDMYIFKGWATSADSTTVEYTVNALYTTDASVRLYAVWSEVVASTTIDGVTTNYDSVQNAINAAGTNKGAVVTLLKDEIAEGVTVASGQNITLDLNGKTLRNLATSGYTVNNMGELTIIGEGTIKGNTSNAVIKSNTTGKTVIDGNCLIIAENHYPISNNNIFIVNNGTIISEVRQAIYNYSTGNVEINGGSVQGVTYGIHNVGGNVTVSDGNVQGNTYGVLNSGNLTITGGSIKGKYAINNTTNSNLKITGGELISESYLINQGNCEITGGKIYGKIYGIHMTDVTTAVLTIGTNEENPSVDITSPVIIGESCGINNSKNYTLNFYDGIIMGPTNQTIQGTVTDTPTGYRVVNGSQTIDGTTYETAYLDNTYYITFDDNCTNGTTTTLDKKYNNKLETLPTPTTQVTGYTFDGWYTDKTAGTKITAETVVSADVTYYAHWVANTDTDYTVYHYRENANDGNYELVETENLKGKSDASLTLANLTKAGENELTNCSVLKTTLTENGESVLTTTIAPDGTTKVYIYYTRNKFALVVTPGKNVNTATGSGTYKWGQTVNLTAEVESLAGYTYSNFTWATTNENVRIEDIVADKTNTNTTLTMPAEELIVSAISDRTAITYNLTYNLDGGEYVDGKTNPATYTVEDEITLNPVEKQGYVFLGWKLSTLNGQPVENSTVVNTIPVGTTGNREYTAVYNNGEVSYTVYHYLENANNSEYTLYNTQSVEAKTNDVITLNNGLAIDIANATYAKSTTTLGGEQGTTVTVESDSSTKIYVYYTRNTYTLNVLAGSNIGTIKINDEVKTESTFKYGATVDISASLANLNGYNYSNFRWETTDTSILASTTANNTTVTMPAANTTVTAVADRTIKTYNITYTLDGGAVAGENPTTYTVESSNITLINPSKTGYTFAGWTGTDLSAPTKNVIISTGSYGDRSYTATWEINQYAVTYDYATNGGVSSEDSSVKTENVKVNYNSAIDLSKKATKANYNFVGWNTDKNATTGIDTLTMGTQNVTLYAIYEKDVTVKFDKNGGAVDVSDTYKMYNTNTSLEITMPEPTTFAGWTFNGYGTTNNATSGDLAGVTKTITVAENVTNVTYYHTWAKTITFNANKPATAEDSYNVTINEISREIYYNNAFGTLPTNPTLPGWTFAGWFTAVNGGTQITKDTLAQDVPANIYAQWTLSTSISVSPENVTLDLSDNKTQTITVTGSNYGDLTYETTDNTVATVDENGVITALKNGTTTITVTGSNGNVTDCITVTVVTTPTSVEISQDLATIGVVENSTVQLNATIEPETANKYNKITWTSSNSNIATVDPETGVVTGVSDGKVTITATTENGYTDTCEITVDATAPTVTVSIDNTNYAKEHTATITITDSVSGLPASQEISYAWSTSKDAAPQNWETSNINATAPATSSSITVKTPSDVTGVYYLWVKSGIKDNFENTTTQNYINTQATANLDNIAPTVTINPNTKEYTIAVGENMATIGTTITATDNENGSGIAITKYAWSTSNTEEPQSWLDFTNAVEVTKTVEGGKYYVWTNVEDTAGNKAVSVKTSGEFNVGYAVEYNANGGVGEIASQRKEHGANLTITNEKPTRDMYIFKGWATSADSATVEYAANVLYTTDAPIRLYAVWSEVVASTTIDGVTTNYDSVQGAIDAAGTNPGATVTLLKDEIAETVTIAKNQDINIDLNGKTWANTGSQTITNNGKLTLKGDGKVTSSSSYTITNNGTFDKYGNGTIEYTGRAYAIRNAGTANLYEGTITSNNIGVDNKDGGKVVVSGIKIDTIGIALYNRANTTAETISNPGILITSGLIESDNVAIGNEENRAIDIQGGTIKSNAERAIYNLGNTKIQIANATVEGTVGIENSQGEIIVNEGANIIGTTNYGIDSKVNAKVTINGGTVEGYDSGIKNTNAQVLVNEGSNIIGTTNKGIVNYPDGIVEITGGTVTGKIYGIRNEVADATGTIIVTGGKITSESIGIESYDGTIILGTNDGTISTDTPYIFSKDMGISLRTGITTFEFYDGIAIGLDGKSISGTVTKIPDGYCIEKGTETIDGVEYETSYLAVTNYAEYNADTLVKYYGTLKEAFEEVTSGNTIKPLKDITDGSSADIELAEGKTVTLDLNGYTITTTQRIVNSGTLEIKDSKTGGTFNRAQVGSSKTAIYNIGNGLLTVNSGKIQSAGHGIVNDFNGKVIVNNGTIEAQLNALMEDSKKETNENNPGLVVKGGTITSVRGAVITDDDCVSAVIIEGGQLTTTGAYPTILNKGNGLLIIDKEAQITGNYENGTVSNGYLYPSTGAYATGTIEIRGGTITAPGIAVYNEELGIINISGGTITAGTLGAINYREGTINVTGGNITGTFGVRNGSTSTGTINVSGGTITATEKAAIGTYKGTTTITGGNITGATYGVYTTAGTTVITGGTIKATGGYIDSGEEAAIGAYIGKGVVVEGEEEVTPGTLTIGSWTEGDTEAPSITVPSIEGAIQGVMHEGGTFNFYDGVIKGSEDNAIRGGTSQIPTGYAVQKTTGEGVQTAILVATNYAEYNGSTFVKYYETLEEAFDGVTSENIIKPLKDVTDGSSADIELAEGKTVTLDLNGYTITTTQRIVNTGTLQIKDSKTGGTFNRAQLTSSQTAIYNIGNGLLTVNSGKIQSVGHGIVNGENGKVVFNNGTIEAQLNALRDDSVGGIDENNPSIVIKGGTITSARNVLVVYGQSNTAVVIEGGQLTTTGNYPTILNQGNSLIVIKGTVEITGNYADGMISNGYLYPSTNQYATGTIDIRGGTITAPGIAVYNEELGTINISGGTITAEGQAVINYREGTINVTGGNITGTFGVRNGSTSTGTINVSGGTIIATEKAAIGTYKGTTTITGGNITGATYGVYTTAGTTVITGGTIKATGGYIDSGEEAAIGAYIGKGVVVEGEEEVTPGTLTIGSWTEGDTDAPSTTVPSIEGAMQGVMHEGGTFNFYDGVIKGLEDNAIRGGTSQIPTGCTLRKVSDGTTQTITLGYVVASTTVGSTITNYTTVQEAIDAAGTSTATVKLLYTGSRTEILTIAQGQNITLNTNGATLTSAKNTITNNGNLTITGNGKIEGTSSAYTMILLKEGATLTVENGTLESAHRAIQVYANATLNIGKNDGSVSTTSPVIIGKNDYAVYMSNATTLIVNFYDGIVKAPTAAFNNNVTSVAESGIFVTGTETISEVTYNTAYLDTAIASTTIGSTTTKYMTVQEAIDAAGTSAATVKLLYSGSRTEILTIAQGQNITLNTNGATITSAKNTITNNGNLTITGNGTIKGTGSAYTMILVKDGATLTVENGTIEAAYRAIQVYANATLNIGTNDESVSTTSPVIIGKNDYAVYMSDATTSIVNFYDGIVKAPTAAFSRTVASGVSNYTLNVDGTETISGTVYHTAVLSSTSPAMMMFSLRRPSTVVEEEVNNEVSNEINNEVNNETNEEIIEEETNEEIIVQLDEVAQINDKTFATLQEAINSATNGETIKILEDISLVEEVTIPVGKNVIIDLNNKTIASNTINTINNNGTLTISSMGVIKNEIDNGNVIYNNGTINMNNGIITIANNGGKGIYNNGIVNMNEGKIITEGIGSISIYNINNSKTTITNGIIETRGFGSKGIYNDSKLEVKGGNFIVSADDSIGIYFAKNSNTCTIKNIEILVEADVIEDYDLIKNTDEFKSELEQMKPSYGIYNDASIIVNIETGVIKVERLKGIGIANNSKGTILLGKNDENVEMATPIIYAIADNTTAIINNSKEGKIIFYDGSINSIVSVKDIFTDLADGYEIQENVGSSVINTILKKIEEIKEQVQEETETEVEVETETGEEQVEEENGTETNVEEGTETVVEEEQVAEPETPETQEPEQQEVVEEETENQLDEANENEEVTDGEGDNLNSED